MTITNSLPLADFFEIYDLYVMCTKPSACVLFKPDDSRIPDSGFQGLDGSIMPIFPLKKSISWKGYSIRRQQVPMSPAFCLTQYRVQGLTLEKGVLDMKAEPRAVLATRNAPRITSWLVDRKPRQMFISYRRSTWATCYSSPIHDLKLKWIGFKSWKSKPWQHGVKIQYSSRRAQTFFFLWFPCSN